LEQLRQLSELVLYGGSCSRDGFELTGGLGKPATPRAVVHKHVSSRLYSHQQVRPFCCTMHDLPDTRSI